MNYLKQIQSAIDYIETRLESDITAQNIAQHAGMSQWHFQRMFKALTNESLMAYIRARRLSNSLELLLATDLRIVDIAASCGYENQESYTRAFRKAFGMTPGDYRKLKDKARFVRKLQIDRDYISHIQRNVSLEPEIAHSPERRLVGLKTVFYSVDSEKNNVASQLPPQSIAAFVGCVSGPIA